MSETTTTSEPAATDATASMLAGAASEAAAANAAPTDATAPVAEGDGAAVEGEKTPEAPLVPDDYTFTAPDNVVIDDKQFAEYKAFAKENGLTQAQFDKMTEFGLKFAQERAGDADAKRVAAQLEWRNSVIADRDLCDGVGFKPEISEAVGRALDAFGGDDLRAALTQTGAGDHPAIVKAFVQIGKAMNAPGTLDVGRGTGARGSALDIYKTL